VRKAPDCRVKPGNDANEYRNKRRKLRWLLRLPAEDRKKWDAIQDILEGLRQEKEDRDIKLARHNQDAEHALVRITRALDELGKAAVGGLTYRINRSRYFAELYRRQAEALDDSNIETWWSYSQFVARGMEPTLRFIESIGENHLRLQEQLQSIKQDILQSSINNQTESTRDNTYKLERIQTAISRVESATARSARQLYQMKYIYTLLLIVSMAGSIAAAVWFNGDASVALKQILNTVSHVAEEIERRLPPR
jgi:uncharacterized membrane-anchored protein